MPRGGVSRFDSRVSLFQCSGPWSCIDSKRASVPLDNGFQQGLSLLGRTDTPVCPVQYRSCPRGQPRVPVLPKPATFQPIFLSARKFVAQVGAHTCRNPRELEQIFQIAPRQIRQE